MNTEPTSPTTAAKADQKSAEQSKCAPSASAVERTMQRVNYERKSDARRKVEFKLDIVRLMLERLGNPEKNLTIVHIAGTKGKGSTAHYVARIGSEFGLTTGVYSSPHFERYTERFRVNNREVAEETLNPCLDAVLKVAEELDREIEIGRLDLQPATFFDISTVAALLLFKQQNVTLAVLEVGLGGRLDSTNVCQAAVTIITNISLDHTKQLGSTTPKIAAEKAGIIKSSAPTICGPVDDQVLSVIAEKAAEHNSTLFKFGTEFGVQFSDSKTDHSSNCFEYLDRCTGQSINSLQLNVLGSHQISNACLAISAMLRIRDRLNLPPDLDWKQAVRLGLSKAELTGRLEVISRKPMIISDMAHNEASIEAMTNALSSLGNGEKKQVIFSCSKDKDYRAMLRILHRVFDRIILTEFQNNPRCCCSKILMDELRLIDEQSFSHLQTPAADHPSNVEKMSTTILAVKPPEAAFQRASEAFDQYGMTVICGSIFLVGELAPVVRKYLAEPATPCA